jgi:hypothetical protein
MPARHHHAVRNYRFDILDPAKGASMPGSWVIGGAPDAVIAIGATVPNIAVGVALLIFRPKILGLLKKVVPHLSSAAVFWASGIIIVSGLFLIAVAGFLLYTFLAPGA